MLENITMSYLKKNEHKYSLHLQRKWRTKNPKKQIRALVTTQDNKWIDTE